MKKIVMTAMMAMVALFASPETKDVEPFEGVNVNVPARVRFVYGEAYAVEVRAENEYTENCVRYAVKDSVLRISGDQEMEQDSIVITVTCPYEPFVTVGRDFEMTEKHALGDLTLATK
ncbi:MAG: DUF2807 domain-containing protein [Bacteroidales bacterium]|nr:DUF2807 domain-containing protein [Bacteroidales bacterium]